MKKIFENMDNLGDALFADAEEFINRFINRQKKYNSMKRQVKVTALTEEGGSIESGWFKDVNKGEEYARELTARGMVVVKQYREQ